MQDHTTDRHARAIAVVGMGLRFPGARTPEEFWALLRDGIEAVTFFTDDELREAGVPADLLARPQYVKAKPILDDVAGFDAPLFRIAPHEAELMDPQHRLFLECAWEALERAGYDPTDLGARTTGVFAGANASEYLFLNVWPQGDAMESVRGFQALLGNDKDYLATQVAYRLNLRGPCLSVQTACSSSLVAVDLACHALLDFRCDVALAGGVSLRLPHRAGYLCPPGGIFSPDGHCRSFDAKAAGTVFGSGAGVVVLKRLTDARADGDPVHAVILGSAVNNDGAGRVGFTAPGLDGQAEVIALAQAVADVAPSTIAYVEAHGSATPLGDPIEVAALTHAFGPACPPGRCALGSVKSNIGHLDTAAGIAGLIKTVLALEHGAIPPSLHFEEPNPEIDFERSPFFVNTSLSPWPGIGAPRRAGVSAFGIGGTNAHVVLEEAPAPVPGAPSRPAQLLVLSARTQTALEKASAALAAHLESHPAEPLADVTHTLRVGRHAFAHRRAIVCTTREEAVARLGGREPGRVLEGVAGTGPRPVAFLFPGVGDHYGGMGRGLYETEPVFREHVDRCAALLVPHLGLDLRAVLYRPGASGRPAAGGRPDLRRMVRGEPRRADADDQRLDEAWLAQPAVFVVEYALAQLWMAWGIRPQAMLGYSLGEYAAACLAGVLTLDEAIALVAQRARMIHELPPGAMLAVALAEHEVASLLGPELSLGAVTGPKLCVLSGSTPAVEAAERALAARGARCRRLRTTHAVHSPLMEPMVERLATLVRRMRLRPPRVPYVSNVTGRWIRDDEATDPTYWLRHLREPVRLADGLAALWQEAGRVMLEVGPGQAIGSFALQHPAGARIPDRVVLASLPYAHDPQPDTSFLQATVGKLWLGGLEVDWQAFAGAERRRRVPLPTYPFEHEPYWIEPPAERAAPAGTRGLARADVADWFYAPTWKRAVVADGDASDAALEDRRWLVLADDAGLAARLLPRLAATAATLVSVRPGDRFEQVGADAWVVAPGERADWDRLLAALAACDRLPDAILHCWSVTATTAPDPSDEATLLARGFESVAACTAALAGRRSAARVRVTVVANELDAVLGDDVVSPAKAPLIALAAVLPQEHPNLTCRCIDVDLAAIAREERATDALLAEIARDDGEPVVAHRAGERWLRLFEPIRLPRAAGHAPRLRQHGVYLVTGGLGRIGLTLAEHLAATVSARVVLVGRSGLPPRPTWPDWLATHDDTDPTSRRIRGIERIEAAGGEAVTLAADVADEAAMRAVVADVRRRFGALHGVLHAAGATGRTAFRSVAELTAADRAVHFEPKVRGVDVLARVLADDELDFCLLFSSVAATLGGLGFAAYAAANRYLDAVAQQRRHQTTPWLSVAWDNWDLDAGESAPPGLGGSLASLAMTAAEGIDVFERVLAAPRMPRIVVSTADLGARLVQWVERGARRARRQDGARTAHPRPSLQTPYLAPTNDLERRIATVWEAVLGIEQAGIEDNFFDLGGNSLTAVELVAELGEELGLPLPTVALFEAPTIATLATYLATDGARSPAEAVEEVAARAETRRAMTRRQHVRRARPEPVGQDTVEA